jgi:hypothetical protein
VVDAALKRALDEDERALVRATVETLLKVAVVGWR